MATTIVASIYKERLSRRGTGALNVVSSVNRTAGLVLLFGSVVVFGLLSVPSVSEIWPAIVALMTILAAFVYCGYLIHRERHAFAGGDSLIATKECE